MNLDSLIYGGEFPLDLKKTIKFRNLKILNKGSYTLSGRSALYLIIKHLSKNRIRNAILPHLICKSVNDVFKNEGLKLFYYEINKNFEPVINNFFQINNSIILVNHYFGLVNNNINKINSIKNKNSFIVEDFSHLHPDKNLKKNKSLKFLSLRKTGFFPLGGWANIPEQNFNINSNDISLQNKIIKFKNEKNIYLKRKLEQRNLKLEKKNLNKLKKIEKNLSQNYKKHICKKNQSLILISKNIKKSLLQRKKNWNIADKILNKYSIKNFKKNKFYFSYIIFCKNRDKVRKELIKNNIYCPVYWKINKKLPLNSFSRYCSENMLSIPIDQRYTKSRVKQTSKLIEKIVKNIR